MKLQDNTRAWCWTIFVAVFAFNLLTSSREPAWGDAHSMWDVADHIVAHGEVETTIRWPDDAPKGRNDAYYGIAPVGTSLAHVPGVAIAQLGHQISARHDILVKPLATHVGPAALGALACVLFFLLLGDLGIRARTASLCTAILACATTTWVYARMPYSEILQLTCFLGLFRQTLRVASGDSGARDSSASGSSGAARAVAKRDALMFGIWAGCLFNAKYVFASAIVGGLVVIAWSLRKQRGDLVRVAQWVAIGGAPFLVLALWYNWARWGSITQTGYEPYLDAYFGGSMFDGAWGMLLSPNKSAFLYSPPLVLAAIGFPAALRAKRRYGFAVLAMVVPVFLVYSTYRSWSGDWAWGPRFFVWAVPVLLVPIAWVIDAARTSRWKRALVAAVVAIGVVVQLLGCALYWDQFIRLANDAKNQWLGQPNRSGAYIKDRGRGYCDSCFEDTYELLWTPAFQPIRGHWWLIKALARGDTAKEAQADAPWRTYTTLDVSLEGNYGRVRVDWWGLLWMKDATQLWITGLVLLLLLTGGLAFGIWRWLRLHRASPSEPPEPPQPDAAHN